MINHFKLILLDYADIGRKGIFYWVLGICALLELINAMGENAQLFLEFNRIAIEAGEVIRIFACNFTHFGSYHTHMNVLGFLGLMVLLYKDVPLKTSLLTLLIIPVGVGMGLMLSSIETYRGFSGANYGLLAVGLYLSRAQNPWGNGLAFAALLGKMIMEQWPNYDVNYLKNEIGVAVAVESHLSGFITGCLLIVSMEIKRRWPSVIKR